MTASQPSSNPGVVRVTLERGREKPVLQGHPWIFSGSVARVEVPEGQPVDGADPPALARVEDHRGRLLAAGFWSPRSQIRVRTLPFDDPATEWPDRAFFARRLAEAIALRRAVVPANTTGYRLINAEGDGVPGWTVDRFGDVLVSQVTVAGLDAVAADAYAALGEAFPDALVVESNDVPARGHEGLDRTDRLVSAAGDDDDGDGDGDGEIPAEALFQESGLTFRAEIAGGQKTGFYLDQRDSRRRVEALAGGRRVLDLFAHTGAFGAYAVRGGARSVTHVESSPRLVERGLDVYLDNGLPSDGVAWTRADVFEDLRRRDGAGGPEEAYDLIVCDPPPLVQRRRDRDRGARAYKDLNRLALGRLAPGGVLATFSCSGAVDAKLFRQILFSAADEAGVRLALLAPLAAAPDHPVSVRHPQGEYLHGWLARRPGP